MNKADIEFLKDLQHELNTQKTFHQANPRYWGIMERKVVPAFDGYEVRYTIPDVCDGWFTEEEFRDYINENYYDDFTDEQKEEWDDITEDVEDMSAWSVEHFLEDNNIIDNVNCFDVEETDILSQETGCFLTYRAAKEYLDKFGYNHPDARPYAMTAYRNFELERLLNIISTTDFDKIPVNVFDDIQKIKTKSNIC